MGADIFKNFRGDGSTQVYVIISLTSNFLVTPCFLSKNLTYVGLILLKINNLQESMKYTSVVFCFK